MEGLREGPSGMDVRARGACQPGERERDASALPPPRRADASHRSGGPLGKPERTRPTCGAACAASASRVGTRWRGIRRSAAGRAASVSAPGASGIVPGAALVRSALSRVEFRGRACAAAPGGGPRVARGERETPFVSTGYGVRCKVLDYSRGIADHCRPAAEAAGNGSSTLDNNSYRESNRPPKARPAPSERRPNPLIQRNLLDAAPSLPSVGRGSGLRLPARLAPGAPPPFPGTSLPSAGRAPPDAANRSGSR